MNNLLIDDTVKTPAITFNGQSGTLELRGKSIPENSLEFYKPVFDWLDSYSDKPASDTELIVRLEYFNTSSSKCLLDILRRLETIQTSGKSKVKVQWHY